MQIVTFLMISSGWELRDNHEPFHGSFAIFLTYLATVVLTSHNQGWIPTYIVIYDGTAINEFHLKLGELVSRDMLRLLTTGYVFFIIKFYIR